MITNLRMELFQALVTTHACVQVKHGPGRELSAAGDVETRTWRSGQLDGPAQVAGANGDRLEFCYVEVGGSV